MAVGKTIRLGFWGTIAFASYAHMAVAYSGENFVVCNLDPAGDNFLALRSCGASKCKMTRKLGPDTFLLTFNPKSVNGWREVMVLHGLQDASYSGASGWVYDDYICKIDYLWKD